MSLSIKELEKLGKDVLTRTSVSPPDKNKQLKEDELSIYNTVQSIGNKLSSASTTYQMSKVLNKHAYIAGVSAFDNPLAATITDMPTLSKQRAELVKTSSVLQKDGITSASKRMELNSPNYELDVNASTDTYVVAKNKTTNLYEIAFRGTDPKAKIKSGIGKGLPEPIMWSNILLGGHEGNIYDQHNLTKILKNLEENSILPKDIGHISGYSMGGTKAHRLGDMIGVETTLLNPLLGKNFFAKPNSPNVKHNIIRTTEDIATAQGLLMPGNKLPSNVTVNSIDPIAVLTKKVRGPVGVLKDVVALHDLNHFTSEGNRNSEVRNATEIMDERVKRFETETRNANLTPAQRKVLQDGMILEMEPHMKVIGNQVKLYKARTGLMKSVINVGRGIRSAGAGSVGTIATSALLDQMGIHDPYAHAIGGGVASGLADVGTARLLGGATSLINLKSAVLSGGASALAQEATARLLNQALLDAGVDYDTAGIISESAGGGVGGATSVIVPMAVRQVGIIAAQNATRLAAMSIPELAGIELAEIGAEVALETIGEVALETAAEVALETAAEVAVETAAEVAVASVATFNWWNPIGWIMGAALLGTVIAGGVRIAQAYDQPSVDYILHPTRNSGVDDAVKLNPEIQALINDFNANSEHSQENIDALTASINLAVSQDPNVPSDYGYSAQLITAPEGTSQYIVYDFDYSQIPENVRNMNAEDYNRAIGDARLYNEYPMEYYHLTDIQKEHIIQSVMNEYENENENVDENENVNESLNYRLSVALSKDSRHITREYRQNIINPIVAAHTHQEQQREAIIQGLEDYNNENITERVHQRYAEYIANSPEAIRLTESGDINGLNRFIHTSISTPEVVGVIYDSMLTSENRIELLDALRTNMPQFDLSGNVSYISASDEPIYTSAEEQQRNSRENFVTHLQGKYRENVNLLMSNALGNDILKNDTIKSMMEKGALPSEINDEIEVYYQSHPTHHRAVTTRRIPVPKFQDDGSVKFTTPVNLKQLSPEQHRDIHIRRRTMKMKTKPENEIKATVSSEPTLDVQSASQ